MNGRAQEQRLKGRGNTPQWKIRQDVLYSKLASCFFSFYTFKVPPINRTRKARLVGFWSFCGGCLCNLLLVYMFIFNWVASLTREGETSPSFL